MKHILVISDSSDPEHIAFHKGIELARFSGAAVHVVSFIYESVNDYQYFFDRGDEPENLQGILADEARRFWLGYIDGQQLNMTITHEVVWEKYIHRWVIEHCESARYDLIVKLGRRSETLLHTPTDWQLFRDAPVPVYCATKSARETEKVVLVALDLTAKHQEKKDLNKILLEAAFQLAVQTNSALQCCFAIEIPLVIRGMDLIDVPARVGKLESAVREEASSWLDLYDLEQKNLHVREGKSWDVVSHFSRKLKAQCVVVG
ncbi:MAG: universal stress protein, partial [Spongiibacteraceae bacterium]